MQKRKFWEIFFQWVFPCALLVVALVLSIYEFNNKMNSAIRTVVDDQAEQIGYYYSAGVDDKLGALGDITSAMANIMASRRKIWSMFRLTVCNSVYRCFCSW